MIHAIIVDDEQLILDNLTYIFEQLENATLLKAFQNPVEALREYSLLNPDVIFIDINMPSMNGVEFAEKIRELDENANIIFLTAYENYAVNAFSVHAVDYILKPVTTSKLRKSLERITPRQSNAEPAIPGSFRQLKLPGMRNNHIYLIDPADALYISVNQRELTLHTPDRQYQLKQTISYWETILKDSGWFRCHRCFLINLNQISEISLMFNNTYDIRMKNCDDIISVSRTYAAAFKVCLNL